MIPDEPTWDDTGFDAGSNDNSGFMSSGSGGRKRVNPPEPPAPPPPQRRNDDRRGPLFWFGVLAGVVLVLSIVGGFFYWLAQPSVEEQAFLASSESTEVTRANEQPKSETAPEVNVTESDDVVHDPEALDLLFGKDSTSAAAQQEQPAPDRTSPDVAKGTQTPAPSPNVTKRPEKPKPEPSTAAAEPTRTPPSKPVTPLPKPKTETTSAPKTSSALFVIQVFSSPSRADADEWIQRLRDKNVSDAYITEQQIKDQTWYRVRFGSFSTRQEAEAEAIRLGFNAPWIARIR